MSIEDAVRVAREQFDFHRRAHRLWRRTALWLLAAVVLLSVAVVALALLQRPADRVVAATPDGRVIPLTPLEEPIMTGAALAQWTVAAITDALTFGHHDWRLRLGQVRERFTDGGYEGFLGELEESGILARVRDHRQVVSAVAQGAPVIVDTRVVSGRLAWELQFPLLLTFSTGDRELHEPLAMRVLVVRVSRDERPAGIGVEQILAERKRI